MKIDLIGIQLQMKAEADGYVVDGQRADAGNVADLAQHQVMQLVKPLAALDPHRTFLEVALRLNQHFLGYAVLVRAPLHFSVRIDELAERGILDRFLEWTLLEELTFILRSVPPLVDV